MRVTTGGGAPEWTTLEPSPRTEIAVPRPVARMSEADGARSPAMWGLDAAFVATTREELRGSDCTALGPSAGVAAVMKTSGGAAGRATGPCSLGSSYCPVLSRRRHAESVVARRISPVGCLSPGPCESGRSTNWAGLQPGTACPAPRASPSPVPEARRPRGHSQTGGSLEDARRGAARRDRLAAMVSCSEMKAGEVCACVHCRLEVQVLISCADGAEGERSCTERLSCCGEPLALKRRAAGSDDEHGLRGVRGRAQREVRLP